MELSKVKLNYFNVNLYTDGQHTWSSKIVTDTVKRLVPIEANIKNIYQIHANEDLY